MPIAFVSGPSPPRGVSTLRIACCVLGLLPLAIATAWGVAPDEATRLERAKIFIDALFTASRAPADAGRDAAEAGVILVDAIESADPDMASSAATLMARLAAWHMLQENDEVAESLYRLANRVHGARAGDIEHAYRLEANLTAMAWLAEAGGRVEDAERLYAQARDAVAGDFGSEGRTCVREHARLLVRQRRFAEAQALLDAVVAASGMATLVVEDDRGRRRRFLDPHHYVENGFDRAILEAARGDVDAALEAMDRSRRYLRPWMNHALRRLPLREQCAWIRETEDRGVETALSLGMAWRADDNAVIRSCEWLANGKAVATEATADTFRLGARAAREGATGLTERFERLARLRRRLVAMTLLGPRAADPANEAERRRLESEEEDILLGLGEQVNLFADEDARWVTFEEIRAAVPADALVCDIARFRVRDFSSQRAADDWQEARYVAWLVPPAGMGSVSIVDLGPADVIDRAVRDWRREIAGFMAVANPEEEVGGGAPRPAIDVLGRRLAELVLDPLLRVAERQPRELIVIPDGSLWLAPWSALTLDDGRYCIEQFEIRHLNSARDLVPHRGQASGEAGPARALILAAPDFGRVPAESAPATDSDRGSVARGKRLLPEVGPLPGTEREAANVAPRLARSIRRDVDVATEEDATERRFRSVAHPEVLVLATHGFFLGDTQVPTDPARIRAMRSTGLPTGAGATSDYLLADPLARCGVLLAGCNAAGPGVDPSDDGVLSGLEVSGCDLRGTRLVVLSACDTGVGQVLDGEGVAGLRQAFQIAGARTVVSTLWPIPDEETVTLMGGMFDRLAAGASASSALREAQLALIRAQRDLVDTAHPALWAAFTVTGPSAPP